MPGVPMALFSVVDMYRLDCLTPFCCKGEMESLFCDGDGAMKACEVASMARRAADSVLIFANYSVVFLKSFECFLEVWCCDRLQVSLSINIGRRRVLAAVLWKSMYGGEPTGDDAEERRFCFVRRFDQEIYL